MRIETYEKAYLALGGASLVAALLVLLYTSVVMDIHLPSRSTQVDPQTVRTTPPFDQLGVRQTGPGQYEAVMLGQAWAFLPQEIRVPVGAEVTFTVSTPDVIHGFMIAGTRVNLMLIPGQVSRMTYTFRRPGEYALICHEYCGLGHQGMVGRVIVE